MPFTYSIAEGICLGIISYVIINLFAGINGRKKISPMMYILAVLFVLKYLAI
jgi:AGZA family xanthine/uracil permease-like MFS transporter